MRTPNLVIINSEALRNMAIFGYGNITNTTIEHNGTATDAAMNYLYGTLLAFSLPIALLLNPLVFFYNFKKKLTLGSGFFLVLSSMDFLFSFRTLNTVYHLLKPKLEPLLDANPTTYQRFQGFIGYTFGYTSMFVTMVMCVVRYIKIRAPLWSLRNSRIICMVAVTSIVVDVTYSVVVGALGSFVYSDTWMSVFQGMANSVEIGKTTAMELHATTYLIILVPFYIKIGFSVVFSLLTVLYLRSDRGPVIPATKMRSINMILLLNAGNLVWLIMSVATNIISELDNNADDHWNYEVFYLTFLDGVAVQSVLAAYNPLIFCLRITGIRDMIRKFFQTGRMEVNSSKNSYKGGTSSPRPESS